MTRSRDDRGTVAILVAFFAVLLLSMAAMAVDLGLARVERRDVQTITDMATLAGAAGNNLPGTTTGTCSYGPKAVATDKAVRDVAAHFAAEGLPEAPSPAKLVDCSVTNGEALYGTVAWTGSGVTLTHNPAQLTVISPGHRVGFGFAQVIGVDGVTVSGQATAEIRSPAISTLPLYAFTGCDYGRQTISQPNNGHASSGVALAFPAQTNAATIVALTTAPLSVPPTIALPAPEPAPLTITGLNLGTVTSVGFFEPGTSTSAPAPIEVGTAGFDRSATSILVHAVPPAVLAVPGAWYVRVKIGSNWSRVLDPIDPLALLIGVPTLTCGQGSSQGNFGSLLLSNTLVNGEWQQIALNIADRLQHSLAVFPTPGPDWRCSSALAGAVLWPVEGTNCVDTKPGMVANAAQAGFIDGIAGRPGLLTRRPSGSGCGATGVPATTTLLGGTVINNDTLSCFFTNDTVNVGTVSSSSYVGDPVLSPAIYNSSRFAMLPVLGAQPSNGGSAKYQILEFRPAFITNQLNSATRTTPALPGNGLTLDKKGALESVQVVFINSEALPPMEAAGTTPYGGSGPRVLRLVD